MRRFRLASCFALFAATLLVCTASTVSMGWEPDGTPICTASSTQYMPSITSDNAGGAIVTWIDVRSSVDDVYAQRVDNSGTIQWTADGVAICTAEESQYFPVIVSDGIGGAIVAWKDYRNGNEDIYAQRVSSSGTVQWTPADGVAICTHSSSQDSAVIASDGTGGAIVAWKDYRNGNWDIYAQRVDNSGTVQWTAYGVAICAASGHQGHPVIVSDGAGGAIVAWRDNRSGSDIYAQRVDNSGTVQWTANGVALCTASGPQDEPVIVSDGGAGAIVSWEDYRSGTNWDIYAGRVISSTVQWTAALCTDTEDQNNPTIASDGAGGAIVTWDDERGAGFDDDIYAQRVDGSGNVQWMANGAALCTDTEDQYHPKVVADGVGGAIVAWADRRGSDNDIYAQRVDDLGMPQWTPNGVPVCTATGDQPYNDYLTIVSDGASGAIVAWRDNRSGIGNSDIYAQRITHLGDPVPLSMLAVVVGVIALGALGLGRLRMRRVIQT